MSINTAFCANTIASDATCVPTIEQRRLTCPVLRKSNMKAYATFLRRPYPFTYFNTQLVTALSTMSDALHSILRLFQCNKKERTAVLSGLDAVGKTTLLYKLKLGMVVQTIIPTIGLNVETIRCPSKLSRSKLTLTCWDVGGCNHPHINYLHRSFVKAAEVVLWLVDSTDRERIGESAEVLEDLCRDKSTPDREDRGIAPNVPILM